MKLGPQHVINNLKCYAVAHMLEFSSHCYKMLHLAGDSSQQQLASYYTSHIQFPISIPKSKLLVIIFLSCTTSEILPLV